MYLAPSNDDYTTREFIDHCFSDSAWRGARLKPQLRRLELVGADQVFESTPHGGQLPDYNGFGRLEAA
jgi:hypothetical protein